MVDDRWLKVYGKSLLLCIFRRCQTLLLCIFHRCQTLHLLFYSLLSFVSANHPKLNTSFKSILQLDRGAIDDDLLALDALLLGRSEGSIANCPFWCGGKLIIRVCLDPSSPFCSFCTTNS